MVGGIPFHESLHQEHLLNYYGYQVCRHGGLVDFADFKENFSNHLKNKLFDFSKRPLSEDTFKIEKYHNFIIENRINHEGFIKNTGRKLNLDFSSHVFITKLIKSAEIHTGQRFKIYKNQIEFRVVRPGSNDNNPLHRDHWFPYFTPLLNVYVPLSGSYCNSSLGIVPFSHKWSDQDVVPSFTYDDILQGTKTTKVNGIKTSVPEIKTSRKKIQLHRPDVLEGDFMLFSPLCVHGGGGNDSFSTRFSLEFRLEVVK